MFDSKDFKCWINCAKLCIPMHSSIFDVATSHRASLASWALPAHIKKDTPSPSVGSFHVKDQHKHLGVTNGEVTCLGNKKAMTSWLLKGVIGHVVEVLEKITKKDVRKGLLFGNYDGVEVEEYNAINFDTNEDFMLPSNH
jgi:hypothetical protein